MRFLVRCKRVKEVSYPHMEKIGMFRENTFDPVTKEKQSTPSTMSCKVDNRYDTGLIICKEEGKEVSIWKVAIAAIVLIIIAVFSFSIEIEVAHLEELPFVAFLLTYPQILIAIVAAIVIAIVLIRRYR